MCGHLRHCANPPERGTWHWDCFGDDLVHTAAGATYEHACAGWYLTACGKSLDKNKVIDGRTTTEDPTCLRCLTALFRNSATLLAP